MEKVAELAIQRTSSLKAQKIMKIQLGNEGASFRILYSMHTGPNRKEKKNYIAKNTREILREMEWIWRHYIF